jgi:hypothetical protein
VYFHCYSLENKKNSMPRQTIKDSDVAIPLVREERYKEADWARDFVPFTYFPDPDNHDEKIKLKVPIYSNSADEDVECFFETLVAFRKAMIAKKEWKDDAALNSDASTLFLYFGTILGGDASHQWEELVSETNVQTWRNFKLLVSDFITTKILPLDAYHKQKEYMEERPKPYSMEMAAWWSHYVVVAGYLRYFLTRQLMEEVSNGEKKTYSDLWNWGHLTDAELKQNFLRIQPEEWMEKFNDSALDRHSSMPKIYEFFSRQDDKVQHQRKARKLREARRVPVVKRGGARMPYYYQDRESYRNKSFQGRVPQGFQAGMPGRQPTYSRAREGYPQQQRRPQGESLRQRPQQQQQQQQQQQRQSFQRSYQPAQRTSRFARAPQRGYREQQYFGEEEQEEEFVEQVDGEENLQTQEAPYDEVDEQDFLEEEVDPQELNADEWEEDIWLAYESVEPAQRHRHRSHRQRRR